MIQPTNQQLMISMIILLPLACIPALIAKKKGRSFFLWYIYAFGFFAFAFIHSLMIMPIDKNTPIIPKMTVSSKKIIFRDKINYTYIECPVDPLSYEIIQNDIEQKVFCLLNMFTKDDIETISLKLDLYDSLGNFISSVNFKDLEYKNPLELDLTNYEYVKTAQFDILEVCNKEGIKWSNQNDKVSYDVYPLAGSVLAKLKQLTNEYALCLPVLKENYWVCSCTKANTGDTCALCGINKNDLFNSVNEQKCLELKNEQIRYNNIGKARVEDAIKTQVEEQINNNSQERKRFFKLILLIAVINLILYLLFFV